MGAGIVAQILFALQVKPLRWKEKEKIHVLIKVNVFQLFGFSLRAAVFQWHKVKTPQSQFQNIIQSRNCESSDMKGKQLVESLGSPHKKKQNIFLSPLGVE